MGVEHKKVVLGGTFETLHSGHRALFKKAFELGEVVIGLTSDQMAKKHKKRKVRDFGKRKNALEKFIKKEFPPKAATIKPRTRAPKESKHPTGQASTVRGRPKIVKIEDEFGPILKEDFDYIVVSPETHKTAVTLNEERKKRGKKPLKIVKVNFVLAEDGKPISDSRILMGEIDSEGKMRKK